MKNLLFLLPGFWLWWTEKTAYIYMKSLKKEFNVFSASIFWWWARLMDFKNCGEDTLVAEWDYWKIKEFIVKNNIDIIYMHWISKSKNTKELINFLDWVKNNWIIIIETSPFSVFSPDTDKYIDYKLFVSKGSLLKFLRKFKNSKITKYDYLYNPIDSDYLQKFVLDKEQKIKEREKLWINKEDFVIWKVWRADLWKWDDTIINIVPLLIKDIPNLKVVIRSLPNYKLKKIKKLWIEKYFVLLPESVDERDIANTYQIMDVMLHTSRIGESFGIALVEWMFFWIPVLTTDTDWMQRTVFDRDNSQWEILWKHNKGFVNNDINSIIKIIRDFYGDKSLIENVWSKNKKYAIEHYSNVVLKDKLLDIIEWKNEGNFDINQELTNYKSRIIKTSFLYRVLLSIKALFEYVFCFLLKS